MSTFRETEADKVNETFGAREARKMTSEAIKMRAEAKNMLSRGKPRKTSAEPQFKKHKK